MNKIDPYKSFISERGFAYRELLGSFITDKEKHRQGILFYRQNMQMDVEQTLLENYARVYDNTNRRTHTISLTGLSQAQLQEKVIVVSYPHVDGPIMTSRFKDNILKNWALENGYMDDVMYQYFISLVLNNFDVRYDEKKKIAGLTPKNISKISYSVDELLIKEVEQGYRNKTIGDSTRRFGYTHILRRNLNLKLQTFQIGLLMNWRQFNIVCGSRRIGKTFLSAFIAYRELYRVGSGYGDRERQILYVCVSEDKMWQPKQYIKHFIKHDLNSGIMRMSGNEIHNTLTGAKLLFVTAGGRTGARSFGADLVIIDEGAEISNDYWYDLLPIVLQEQAVVFAISTINDDSQQNWFYKELLHGELSSDPKYNTIRATIDDNELLDGPTREAAKSKMLESSAIKYWTEFYCVFPNTTDCFNIGISIKPEQYFENSTNYIIGYDPGKLVDYAGIVVVDMDELRVISAEQFKNVSYFAQKEIIKALKEKYNATLVMDRTGVGEAVWEILGNLPDISIKYTKTTNNKGDNYNYDTNIYNVQKKDMVEALQIYFDNYHLTINSGLQNLIKEIRGFKKVKTASGITYGGEGVNDDLVNALMMCAYYMQTKLRITKRNQIDPKPTQEYYEDGYKTDKRFSKYLY